MNYCEIKNSDRGQTLKEMSGLSEFNAYSYIRSFFNENNRMPELDEIPLSNSEPYFKKQFLIKNINGNSYIKGEDILEATGSSTIEEANIKLNDEYKDLEIHLNSLGSSTLIDILHRPTEYPDEDVITKDIDFDGTIESNSIVILDALDRLLKYYGINITPITKLEMTSNPKFAGMSQAEAFILDGNIYINLDKATVDAPIHELLHLFLGSIRFSNPKLYFQLVQTTMDLPHFKSLAKEYPNRTMSDILEEIFVLELAKFLTKLESLFDNVNPATINYILYNIKRDIDSIVFGKQSVKTLGDNFAFYSLLDLGKVLDSDNFDISTASILDDAKIHRMMANVKEDLMAKNELIETCS